MLTVFIQSPARVLNGLVKNIVSTTFLEVENNNAAQDGSSCHGKDTRSVQIFRFEGSLIKEKIQYDDVLSFIKDPICINVPFSTRVMLLLLLLYFL